MSYCSCRHCGAPAGSYPRKLCYRCYNNRRIRNLYPSTSKYAGKQTVIDRNIVHTALAVATDTLPGSEERIQVLAERARKGLPLRNPADAPLGDED